MSRRALQSAAHCPDMNPKAPPELPALKNKVFYDTSEELFDREMKYPYDNGYKVLWLTDLGYDKNENHF